MKTIMEKNWDRKGRWRNKTIAFRLSPEESVMLNRKVALSGVTKQDYIINNILDKKITVYGKPFVFKNLKNELIRFTSLYGTTVQEDD